MICGVSVTMMSMVPDLSASARAFSSMIGLNVISSRWGSPGRQ